MTVLISPSKQMDFNSDYPAGFELTDPLFTADAARINVLLRRFNRESLAELMRLSPVLADQVFQMIETFGKESNPGRPALFAYSGTVFKAVDPSSLSNGELSHADTHLRILSGMYGILRPFDMIEPYRLEMKTVLDTDIPAAGRKKSLSSFWMARVTQALGDEPLILNLASSEYAQAVNRKQLKGKMLDVHFKERSMGGLRTVGMYAKRARGMMVRQILQEKITDPGVLKIVDIGGYRYDPKLSDASNWLFVRG